MPPAVMPWPPARATERLRALAADDAFSLNYTSHTKKRMLERDLTTGDAMYVLRYGFVYQDAEPANRPGCFKYAMESRTPNSGNRTVRVIVIPLPQCEAKIVTIMWADE